MIARRGFLATVASLAALSACRRAPRTGLARRVVSISASTTEALFAVGAGGLVVGRSRFCDHPKEALALPVVGGFVDPSLEAVLALEPDLVVGARGPAGPGFSRTLEERGIATWFPETERIDDIFRMIEGLGARTGHATDAAALVERLRNERASLIRELSEKPRKRVLLLFSKKPITAAGPGSFPDEMLALAHATNVVASGAAYPTLSLEQIAAFDPDLVLDAEMGGGAVPVPSTFSVVRAVAEGRVRRLTEESVLRPGPRVIDGARALVRAIHGA